VSEHLDSAVDYLDRATRKMDRAERRLDENRDSEAREVIGDLTRATNALAAAVQLIERKAS
jgi:flagellar hook-basal body complex protein FliE